MSRLWTEEEIAELRRLVAEGVPDAEIGRLLHRSEGAVDGHRRLLKIHREGQRSKFWTEAEIAVLTENMHRSLSALVELLPGRCAKSISHKRCDIRRHLGLTKTPPRGAEPVRQKDAERPLWVPFVSASGVKAIRTEAGVVPFVSLIHTDPGHALTSSPA